MQRDDAKALELFSLARAAGHPRALRVDRQAEEVRLAWEGEELRELRSVVAEVEGLPREIPPPPDLWPDLARDLRDGGLVARKRLHPDLAQHMDLVGRFVRDAEALAGFFASLAATEEGGETAGD